MDLKSRLTAALLRAHADLVAKVDGLGEYDARRPLVPSGSNLLGLVKHVASVEIGYVADVFGRDSGVELPWDEDDAEPDADMWVPAGESSAEVLALADHAAAQITAAAAALDLDSPGRVSWWEPERAEVTFGQILVHLLAEVARHAGHADVLRELVDGSTGRRAGDLNVVARTQAEHEAHLRRLEDSAATFRHAD